MIFFAETNVKSVLNTKEDAEGIALNANKAYKNFTKSFIGAMDYIVFGIVKKNYSGKRLN